MNAVVTKSKEAWGNTCQSCLRWAYNSLIKSNTPPGVLGKELTESKSTGSGLSRLEQRGDAAWIRLMVETLNPIQRALLEAIYLPSPVVDRFPGRAGARIYDRFGVTRGKSIESVAYYLAKEVPTAQPRPIGGWQELVAQYAVSHFSNDRIQVLLEGHDRRLETLMKVRHGTAAEVRKPAFATLDQIRRAGEAEVEAKLRDKDWIT